MVRSLLWHYYDYATLVRLIIFKLEDTGFVSN